MEQVEGQGATARTIQTGYLARVEGEGGMFVSIADGRVQDVRLSIFEPPRFFEAFLRGRHFTEAPDLTARICGICPVAYQMSACHAMESACGVQLSGPLRQLRRLLYCGEWIESHALHVYMLHAPDFFGVPSAIELARESRETVARGLRLKKIGNDLLDLLGGRAVHPINVKLGGFYRVPTRAELRALVDDLCWALETSLETVRWVASLTFPELERDYELVALRHEEEYPLNEGRIVSSRGLDSAVEAYSEHFVEAHVAHSNALHSRRRETGSPYLVGPLARFALCYDQLTPLARRAAEQAGVDPSCRNPFKSIIVRAVELVFACEEVLRIIEHYEPPERPAEPVTPRPGVGHGCTEAPRGMLYHRYQIDEQGLIVAAQIVPPTAQNQLSIEDDLRAFVQDHLDLSDDQLTWRCEQAIRNYDPCISCATHFLRVTVERR